MNIKRLKQKGLVLFMAIAIAASAAGCTNNNSASSAPATETTSSGSDAQASTSGSDTQALSGVSSNESSNVSTSPDQSSNVTGSGTYDTSSPTSKQTSTSVTDNSSQADNTTDGLQVPQQDFKVNINYHPGVPGYNVVYETSATYKGTILNRDDYVLDVNLSGVTVSANKVIVPDAVRQQGKTLTITSTYKKDTHYKYKLDISLQKWTLTLDDNFSTLNPNTWSCFQENYRNSFSPYAIAKASAASIENGHLVLTASKGPGTDIYEPGISTSGKFSQIYGCFTAKIKMPQTGAMDCAFWLMPQGRYRYDGFYTRTDKPDKWLCSEIDIVEYWNESSNETHHTEHFWGDSGQYMGPRANVYSNPNFKPGQYYEYTCVWTKYAIYYYVDGNLVAAMRDIKSVNPVPAYIVLSAGTAPSRNYDNETITTDDGQQIVANYNGWFGYMKDSDFPISMEVQYCRVYK